MGEWEWLEENWVATLNAAGIVGSLLFTALSLRADIKTRRIGNLMAITKGHREIWTEFLQRPKLKRVVDAHADICSQPVTWDEKVFVRLVIVHLHSVHQASDRGLFIKPEGLRRDVWSFFSLPIPATVWEDEKAFQDDEFVDYVEQCRMWK